MIIIGGIRRGGGGWGVGGVPAQRWLLRVMVAASPCARCTARSLCQATNCWGVDSRG